jgi:superfamily II DNA or RNA helicase
MADLGARFGLVVFDEVHHLPGKVRREAATLCAAPLRLGLTATPERADGLHKDLDWLVGPEVFRLPVSAVRGRTLADYDVVRIPIALDERERSLYNEAGRTVQSFIAEQRAEYNGFTFEDLCAAAGSDPAARRAHKAFRLRRSIEDRATEKLRVLEDIFRLHADERVIVFAGSNAMAFDVSRRFLLPTILSHTAKRERTEVLDGFASGRLRAIVANQVLDEGVDVPATCTARSKPSSPTSRAVRRGGWRRCASSWTTSRSTTATRPRRRPCASRSSRAPPRATRW